MFTTLKQLILDDEGASLVEYALIVALVSVVAIGAIRVLGSSASTTLNNAANQL